MNREPKASSLREWAEALFWCGIAITTISFVEGMDAAFSLLRH